MLWRHNLHNLTIKFEVDSCQGITKREFLYPLALLGPVIARTTIIFPKLLLKKLSCTDYIRLDDVRQWQNFLKQLSDVSIVKLPRSVLISSTVIVELHGVSDASELTYGSAVYLS